MKTNQVQLIGYVGDQPIVHAVEKGGKWARIRVGTHDVVKTEGEKKTYGTTWHQVVAFGEQADVAERSFVKGSHILVAGRIVYRTYPDQTGHKRYVAEIKAHSLLNLDR